MRPNVSHLERLNKNVGSLLSCVSSLLISCVCEREKQRERDREKRERSERESVRERELGKLVN